jgi:hypothetical protein
MSVKLSVGIARKIGQPRYSSYGASCAMEAALTPAEAASPDDLQQQIRRGFDICRAAVEAELAFERRLAAAQAGLARAARCARSTARRATPAQIRAIHAIVARRRLDLYLELAERYDGRRLDELTLAEASGLIDALNAADHGALSEA